MSTYQPNAENISYGEYKATKFEGVKSQIYSSNEISSTLGDISSSEQVLSKSFQFSKILPVKVLPPISQEEYNNTANNDINIDFNSFNANIIEGNTEFDFNNVQPTPTLESYQSTENTFGNEINIPEATQEFNHIAENYDTNFSDNITATQTLTTEYNSDLGQNFDTNNLEMTDTGNTFNIPETTLDTNITTTDSNFDINALTTTNVDATTNIEPTQTYDVATFQSTEITPSYDIPETTNIDTNTYQTSEPIIDTTTTTTTENFDINALNLETSTNIDTNINFDINNIQTSEPIIETGETNTTTENLDLNALTTTNVEPTQTFDASTFQSTEITPSYDIPETTNVDTNTYQSSEPIIGTTTTTTENFDINNITSTETQSYDINAIPETTNIDTNIFPTGETTTTENFDLTNIATTTNIETTNYESNEIPLTTTTDNFDINTLGTVDANIDSTNINIDTTSTEDYNITNLPPVTNIESSTQNYDMNNFESSEPLTNTQFDSATSLDINSNALTTNINEETYNSSEFGNVNIDNTPDFDTISDLRATPAFNLGNFESTNTEFETNNIIDSTSALQTNTFSTPEFDINAFTSTNNVETATNVETNTFDASAFQSGAEAATMSFGITGSNIETYDINSLTNNNITSTEAYNTTDFQTSNKTEVQNFTQEINTNEYIPPESSSLNQIETSNISNQETVQTKFNLKETKSIFIPKTLSSEINVPHFTKEEKSEEKKEEIVFSVVTPLKGNIAKGTVEKNVAKVTLVPNYGILTYRPFERKKFGKDNSEINIGKINKSLVAPTEYKISTFNPKHNKL